MDEPAELNPVINPEAARRTEIFTTENEPLALRMRFALNQLNPNTINLPDVDAANIVQTNEGNRSEVRKTIAKAATNDAIDKWLQKENEDPRYKVHQEKVALWKKEFVLQFRLDDNQQMVKTLKDLKVGDIDFTNINDEQSQKIYDRYVARRGQTNLDAIQRGERKFVLYDINQFEEDMIQTHTGDFAFLGEDLNAIQWLATRIFGAEDAKNIFDDLTKEIQLKTNRDTFVKQANEKATKNGQEISRLNWPHGQNEEEYRRLNRLSDAQSITTAQIDVTQPPETPHEQAPVTIRPTLEPEEEPKHPWTNVPKPDQPTKISEGIVAKDSHGKITSETAERHLLIGTPTRPLVVRNKWSDGSETTSRIRSPERPYHIPAVIYFDNDITSGQRILIQNTLNQVFQEIGVPQDMIVESQKSASEIFTRVTKNKDRSNQFDASLVLDVAERETNQINQPHHMIIFTNKDLYMENVNFVVGAAQPDSGTLISLSRIWQSIKDSALRDNTIKTEIAHELGHVYGLPTNRRGKENLDFETVPGSGAHCKSPGCSMKQGNVVPADFIRITQDRLANLRDKFFCLDCQRDLQQKFKKI